MKKIVLSLALVLALATAALAAITNLAWDANTEADLVGYKLYQKVGLGPYALVKTLTKAELTTATANLPDGAYCWVLTAYDSYGNESGYSNEVCRTIDTFPPAAPKNLRLAP